MFIIVLFFTYILFNKIFHNVLIIIFIFHAKETFSATSTKNYDYSILLFSLKNSEFGPTAEEKKLNGKCICTKIKKFILITNFKSSNELFFHRIIVDVKQMIESCRLRGFVCTAYRLCKKHYLLYFSKKVYADRDTSRI